MCYSKARPLTAGQIGPMTKEESMIWNQKKIWAIFCNLRCLTFVELTKQFCAIKFVTNIGSDRKAASLLGLERGHMNLQTVNGNWGLSG